MERYRDRSSHNAFQFSADERVVKAIFYDCIVEYGAGAERRRRRAELSGASVYIWATLSMSLRTSGNADSCESRKEDGRWQSRG